MAPKCYDSTHEALVFKSLQEIIKIWSSGSGQADLTLTVCDGSAELRLNVCLGRPSDSNIPSSEKSSFSGTEKMLKKNKKRRKCPSKQARDRKRAEVFRLKKADIVLPISGELLPLKLLLRITRVTIVC